MKKQHSRHQSVGQSKFWPKARQSALGRRTRQLCGVAGAATVLLLALLPWQTSGFAQTGSRIQERSPTPAAGDTDYKLGILDRLRVKVIEYRASRDEVYEWAALNSEYTIGSSGKVSLPLVGELRATGLSTSELGRTIGDRLRERMGLVASPDTSVEVVQFRPFYIIGHVEKPGEYPYRPGLTVLQAATISGGFRRADSATRLEREVITSKGELDQLAWELNVLSARTARLEAELKQAEKLTFPPGLLRRRIEPAVAMLIEQEEIVFQARRTGFDTQIEALKQLKGYLESEVQSLTGQLGTHDTQMVLMKQELAAVASLSDKGLVTASRRMALERTVAQFEGEHMRRETALLKAKQDISRTDISIIELHNKRVHEITSELQQTHNKMEQAKQRTDTSERLLYEAEVIAPRGVADRGGRMRKVQPVYHIQRATDGLVIELTATEATAVEPGDSIKVEFPLGDELTSAPLQGDASPRAPATLQRFTHDLLGRVQN